ncbi:hypothetical protein MUK42_28063 [Musa troglodytarum]|uniref:Uncharacterized protein n=1 Tax=Musa troglodytarum TaxID=320322 RepID=A0A9E7F5Z0_9LILI|nr:hypothetical protein MUK42_28063 [Musa troglodytarum]
MTERSLPDDIDCSKQTMFWKKNEIAASFALYVSLDVRYDKTPMGNSVYSVIQIVSLALTEAEGGSWFHLSGLSSSVSSSTMLNMYAIQMYRFSRQRVGASLGTMNHTLSNSFSSFRTILGLTAVNEMVELGTSSRDQILAQPSKRGI